MRLALARIPDGNYSRTDHLDDGSPICVAITTRRASGGRLHRHRARPRDNLNANRAIVTAAVLYVFRCLIGEDIPLNSGVLEPIEIVLPTCLLNPEPPPIRAIHRPCRAATSRRRSAWSTCCWERWGWPPPARGR